MDGHVKVWWFEKIDQADPPDDDRVILVDPTYDFYTPGVKLMSIEKRNSSDSGDTFWYAQVGPFLRLTATFTHPRMCNRTEMAAYG